MSGCLWATETALLPSYDIYREAVADVKVPPPCLSYISKSHTANGPIDLNSHLCREHLATALRAYDHEAVLTKASVTVLLTH